jgi:copper(I)-binding protein
MFTLTVEENMKLILLIMTLLILPLYSSAHKFEAKYVIIDHPWLRIAGEQSITAAGYFELTNKLNEPIILIGAKAEFATIIEIHEIKMENGVAKMRLLNEGLTIEKNKTVELKPMGLHLMFMGINKTLKKGEMMEVELIFENLPSVVVKFKVDLIKDSEDHH